MEIKALNYTLIDETLGEVQLQRKQWEKEWAKAMAQGNSNLADEWKDLLNKSKKLEKKAKRILKDGKNEY